MDTTLDRAAATRAILAGLCASLVGIGLARFAYTPLIPPLIEAHWFAAQDVVFLGAANLAGCPGARSSPAPCPCPSPGSSAGASCRACPAASSWYWPR